VFHPRRPPTTDRAEPAPAAGSRATDAAPTSALAALADAELRLDRAIAAARDAAAAAAADARRRAEQAAAEVDGEIARARARITAEIADKTCAQLGAIAAQAGVEAVRFDAVRGDALEAIARQLADRLVAIALDEAPGAP